MDFKSGESWIPHIKNKDLDLKKGTRQSKLVCICIIYVWGCRKILQFVTHIKTSKYKSKLKLIVTDQNLFKSDV